MPKVAFLIPSIDGPYRQTLEALEASVPFIEAAGFEHAMKVECGPYISHNRATLLRKALDWGADMAVFLDHDMSWAPQDLIALLQADGDVVAGFYRYKKDEEAYMGAIYDPPQARGDGAVKAFRVPAGFLKVTRNAVRHIMRQYPELIYGDPENPSIDLFQHGAHKGTWYGEDMAFSRRWIDCGGEIWLLPDLNLTHHAKDKAYPGNFHEFMCRQPGGAKEH